MQKITFMPFIIARLMLIALAVFALLSFVVLVLAAIFLMIAFLFFTVIELVLLVIIIFVGFLMISSCFGAFLVEFFVALFTGYSSDVNKKEGVRYFLSRVELRNLD